MTDQTYKEYFSPPVTILTGLSRTDYEGFWVILSSKLSREDWTDEIEKRKYITSLSIMNCLFYSRRLKILLETGGNFDKK